MSSFLLVILFFAFIASIVFTVLLIFSKKGTARFDKNRKRAFLSLGVAIVSFILCLAVSGSLSDTKKSSSSNDTSSSKTEKLKQSKNTVASSSSKQASSSENTESSSSSESSESSSSAQTKNVEQANAAILERLTQAQGWANGTLDSNGNPTSGGTPNPAYNWVKIVTSIKYAENELTIYVNKNYVGMSKTQFANYMYTAENSALNALNEANIINEDAVKSGLYTRVFDGDTKIAQSKITDRHQFKINQ